jgi:hypothetical protein
VTAFALRIAGLTVRVSGDEPFDVVDPMARFLTDPDARPDLDLTVRRGAIDFPSGPAAFDSGGVWSLYEHDDGATIICRSPVFTDDPFKAVHLDRDFTRGEIVLSNSLPPRANPLDYPLDELLFSNLLGRGAGVELHCLGIIDRGKGYLFVGQSGAGKTTTSRLWSEADVVILSDDRVIVREEGSGYRIHGTPWHGEAEVSAAADAPLSAIFLLSQATTIELRPLEEAEAVPLLFGCTFPLFHRAESVGFALSFLSRMVQRVPVFELRFTPSVEVVDAVRRSA